MSSLIDKYTENIAKMKLSPDDYNDKKKVRNHNISKSTPLANEPFALSHQMTAKSLGQIGEIGGPRCCKRDLFLSILAAVDYVKDHFSVEMEKPEVVCQFSSKNNQCIGKRCPFSKVNH